MTSPRREHLPVDDALPGILDALRDAGAVVVVSPPGSGKTTRIPSALLDSGLLGAGSCLVLEPRRVAARAAARRVGEERGVGVGAEVGYHVRFERKCGPSTRLVFATDGILLARLQADPLLAGVAAVVLDEFHERSIELDLSLAFLKEVRRARPDLLLVILSATLRPEPVAAYLGARTVQASGVPHPVAIRYVPGPEERMPRALGQSAAAAVRAAWPERPSGSGSLLVFLPGAGEIRAATQELEDWSRRTGVPVLPLHGDLPAEAQDRAVAPAPGDGDRVVLATNVAETSLTVAGVRVVVDLGLARIARHDPGLGLDRLELAPISRAAADQRAGRAGRLGPGVAYRLWSLHDQLSRPLDETPEVRRVDLAAAALQLLAWGAPSPAAFDWFEPPSRERLEAALALLERLGAAKQGRLTPAGRALAALPLHPRLGTLLLGAKAVGLLREGAALAALVSERDVARPNGLLGGERPAATGAAQTEVPACDLQQRLQLLERAEAFGLRAGGGHVGADPAALRGVARVRDQLISLARSGARARSLDEPRETALRRLVLLAYPDRVARRREGSRDRYVLVGGRGAVLDRGSCANGSEFITAVRLDAGGRGQRSEATIRWATAVEPAWLRELGDCSRRTRTLYDDSREQVVGIEGEYYGDLCLAEHAVAPDPAEARRLLAEEASREPAALLSDPCRELLARCAFLDRSMPELDLPSWGTDAWREIFSTAAEGLTSLAALRRRDLRSLLLGRLDARQRRGLDEHAPTAVTVPSGSRRPLRYPEEGAPVLAVKIQEVFGWRSGPRAAAGRVPVVLHLLGPHGRPLQVTSDLESFWTNAYPQIRKEMRGRYPRHHWPEDPWAALPSRRTTQRLLLEAPPHGRGRPSK